ncbi:hypothetical protein [Streptomyces griseorubiginosus]|uniref:Integral membrane protein n=1 Tax=Streptomyces griseorubiginosus TaxID=67304 RepID=A0AAI8KY83_9ACTN|nr:hypothetical protein [Streptomyces griseorubiginosus]AYC37933.1 hypothetical protein DWG14_02152 [Streptomyces griseorubiginosus]KUM78939.1 hypothetical protein AQI84_08020 [Streptomyces griseorubiginosus]
MTAGWCSRTLRAAVFAAVCVLLAALGHVLMSGAHVPGWTLAAGLVVTGCAGWCLAGRERGLPLIVAVAVSAQTALHTAFSLAQPTSAAPDMGAMHMESMHTSGMDSMDSAQLGASSGVGALAYWLPFGMYAAHLIAALVTGLWLAYGERAVFRILRAVAGRLVAPLRLLLALPATPHRPRVRTRRARSERAPRLVLLVHAITHRGPPPGTAVA